MIQPQTLWERALDEKTGGFRRLRVAAQPDFPQIANRPGQRQQTKLNDLTSAFHKILIYSGAENDYFGARKQFV